MGLIEYFFTETKWWPESYIRNYKVHRLTTILAALLSVKTIYQWWNFLSIILTEKILFVLIMDYLVALCMLLLLAFFILSFKILADDMKKAIILTLVWLISLWGMFIVSIVMLMIKKGSPLYYKNIGSKNNKGSSSTKKKKTKVKLNSTTIDNTNNIPKEKELAEELAPILEDINELVSYHLDKGYDRSSFYQYSGGIITTRPTCEIEFNPETLCLEVEVRMDRHDSSIFSEYPGFREYDIYGYPFYIMEKDYPLIFGMLKRDLDYTSLVHDFQEVIAKYE